MGRLEGKVAIVTGGGTGIGEAICKKFAKEGAHVVVAGFENDPVEDVALEIRKEGGHAIAFLGDISLPDFAYSCVEACVRHYEKLDILVNNAGVFLSVKELQDYPEDEFKAYMRHNIMSTVLMSKYALPELHKTKGCIISAGSESGLIGLAENTVYGGTKGFIHSFMKGLAVEQAKHGVRCNCVCPGPIDTSWTHKESSEMKKQNEEMLINATPMARRGTPEEVANVYAFLASDEASFVTGALYSVDGGISVAKGAVGKQTPKNLRDEPDGDLKLKHQQEGASKGNN